VSLLIHFVLDTLSPFLSSSRVKWFTDNQQAARIVQVGSMHFDLHLLASDIFFCSNHGINLEIDWIPRSLNEEADYFIINWTIDGVPILLTVFPRFAKFRDSFLGSGIQVHLAWTHFFKRGKAKLNWWVVPPVVLLSKVLKFMSHSKAQGTLVLPYWPSSPFWPVLVRNFGGFVVDYEFFEGALTVRQGRNNNSLVGSPTWSAHIVFS